MPSVGNSLSLVDSVDRDDSLPRNFISPSPSASHTPPVDPVDSEYFFNTTNYASKPFALSCHQVN